MTATLQPESSSPSRRALLAGALGGLGALMTSALGRVPTARAAAGDPLIIGNTANSAGTANTTLTTSSTGTALLITQNGSGTALRGSAVGAGSIAGFFTANNGTGVSGVTGTGGTYGVFGQNNGSASTGGAMRAAGGNNHGLVATTNHADRHGIYAQQNGSSGAGVAIKAEAGSNIAVFASSNTGTAVYASNSSNGGGVFASSVSSHGVMGVSDTGMGCGEARRATTPATSRARWRS
jgi:hypothetical protein